MNTRAILFVVICALLTADGFAQERERDEEVTEEKIRRATPADIIQHGIEREKRAVGEAVPARQPAARRQGDVQLPDEAYVEDRFRTFQCPAELRFPAGTSFTNQPGLKFRKASATSGYCANDLSPDTDKGGFCIACTYEANVVIRRSSGLNYKCWVSDERQRELTCEYVAPLRPAQTCVFDIQLPNVNLVPYDQHAKGDKDLHSSGLIGGSSVTIKVDAEIQRGLGPQSNALFLVLSASHTENGGDETTFKRRPYAIKLTDQHYADARAVDVANCLESYGDHRPLSTQPKGDIHTTSGGHDWQRVGYSNRRPNIIAEAECRFDTTYDDDMQRVGCRKVVFIEDITIRLD